MSRTQAYAMTYMVGSFLTFLITFNGDDCAESVPMGQMRNCVIVEAAASIGFV